MSIWSFFFHDAYNEGAEENQRPVSGELVGPSRSIPAAEDDRRAVLISKSRSGQRPGASLDPVRGRVESDRRRKQARDGELKRRRAISTSPQDEAVAATRSVDRASASVAGARITLEFRKYVAEQTPAATRDRLRLKERGAVRVGDRSELVPKRLDFEEPLPEATSGEAQDEVRVHGGGHDDQRTDRTLRPRPARPARVPARKNKRRSLSADLVVAAGRGCPALNTRAAQRAGEEILKASAKAKKKLKHVTILDPQLASTKPPRQLQRALDIAAQAESESREHRVAAAIEAVQKPAPKRRGKRADKESDNRCETMPKEQEALGDAGKEKRPKPRKKTTSAANIFDGSSSDSQEIAARRDSDAARTREKKSRAANIFDDGSSDSQDTDKQRAKSAGGGQKGLGSRDSGEQSSRDTGQDRVMLSEEDLGSGEHELAGHRVPGCTP